jgi:hypothetical protein
MALAYKPRHPVLPGSDYPDLTLEDRMLLFFEQARIERLACFHEIAELRNLLNSHDIRSYR